jgi:hypothetical protein
MLVLPVLAACMQRSTPAQTSPPVAAVPAAATTGCLASGDGQLTASLGGALKADLHWSNAQMECEGSLRPDGRVLRVAIAGPLQVQLLDDPEAARVLRPGIAHRVRLIFGIDLADTAEGPAQVLPTNLTAIVEDEALLYATRGNERCAVENLQRTALVDGTERVVVRGYCLGPASNLAGTSRILMPTFSFTARTGGEQAGLAAP